MSESRPGDQVLRAVDGLPPLPAAALRIMQVAQDPKASAADLAVVVSADPAISARVLRVANSALYRRSRPITSVQEALVVLGFVPARNIAVSTTIASAYAADALQALFRVEAFWRHSLAVAFMASDIAGRSRRLDVPSAFTAGVVHDMGRLAMFYADPAGVDQAVARAMATGRSLHDLERELMGYDHAEAGGLLARRWKLPEEICEAIAQHHRGGFANESSLPAVIATADAIVTASGVLPGYVIPGPCGGEGTPGFGHILRQVDSLIAAIVEDAGNVRLAS